MLTYKDFGIKKFILDRLTQIYEDVVKDDPEYQNWGSVLMNFWTC